MGGGVGRALRTLLAVWQHPRVLPSFLPPPAGQRSRGGRRGASHGGRRLRVVPRAHPADQGLQVPDLGHEPEVAVPAQRPAGGRAPAGRQRCAGREGFLGAQPLLRARPAPRHHGHPERHPLPRQPRCPPAHPAARGRQHHGAAPRRRGLGALHLLPLLQGRAVALRVGRQPRLVPLHLGARPRAPGALTAPRRHPRPRLLLSALLSPPGTVTSPQGR